MLTLLALVGAAYLSACAIRFLPAPEPGTPVATAHGAVLSLVVVMRRGLGA